MDTKTSKILSIIAGGIILIAFFMPWTKSMFGVSVSAWDMIQQLFTILSKANSLPEDIRAYLPFILLLLPICSVVIIYNSLVTLDDDKDTTQGSKVVSIIVSILVVVVLIYAQSQNPFSSSTNIFDLLGIGFYLTIIGNVYFLIDLISIKSETPRIYNPTTQAEIFCSNCGKQYYEDSDGQFCEECGNKL